MGVNQWPVRAQESLNCGVEYPTSCASDTTGLWDVGLSTSSGVLSPIFCLAPRWANRFNMRNRVRTHGVGSQKWIRK